VRWEPRSIQDSRALAIAGRCFGDDPHRTFNVGLDSNNLRVTSAIDDSVTYTTDLPKGQTRVIGMACDDTAMVLALAGRATDEQAARDTHGVVLFLCPHDGPCQGMPAPSLAQGFPLRYPVDVARIRGTTVVAMTRHGIVRTASSRDDGATWTPFIVAFDREANAHGQNRSGVPDHLLVLKNQIILYAGSLKPGMTYPVLSSDDLGASWHPPLAQERRVSAK
jgi:hypothetical protein